MNFQKEFINRRFFFYALLVLVSVGFIFLIFQNKGPAYNDKKDTGNSEKIDRKKDVSFKRQDLECPNCNIVIISLTNTRKDHLGIYGYERNTSPNIDRFFDKSLVFENTFAPSSWTLPVSASLFSSTQPLNHGVMDRYKNSRLSDNVVTLAEILKDNGYKTAAITGSGDFHRQFNLQQGFDLYIDETNYSKFNISNSGITVGQPIYYKGIEELVSPAINWLQDNKNEKKFLFLQGYDSHCPFNPKPPFDKMFDPSYENSIDYSHCLWTFDKIEPFYKGDKKYWALKTSNLEKETVLSDRDLQHMISRYDGKIAQADLYLSNFFEKIKMLGMKENTIFIFMSEHGDLFGEHGRFMRGGPVRGTFYQPVLNFPLLLKHPNIKDSVQVDALMQTVDIMPTLFEMINLPLNSDRIDGNSIIPELVNEGLINEYVYAYSAFKPQNNSFFKEKSAAKSIRDRQWKLIEEEIDGNQNKKEWELYNISEDPLEKKNLIELYPDIANKLDLMLNNWLKNQYK